MALVPLLSPIARRRAERLGAPGLAWLDQLPGLIAEFERAWGITAGAELPGGNASCVLGARTADGQPAVLKLVMPDPLLRSEVRTVAGADGNGYVRALAHDERRGVLLLEALTTPLGQGGMPPEQVIDVLAATLRRAWTVPAWPGLEDAEPDKACGLADLILVGWEELDRPCPRAVIDEALRCAERRCAARSPDRCVVVHGDPHPGNALRVPGPRPGAEAGYVLVDPSSFLAEPAYDLGVVLRDWCPQLLAGDAVALARGYCRRLAARTGVDEAAIWDWGFLERVSTGLFVLGLGDPDAAEPFLRSANALLG
jgi:streptomycin 6-kinase